MNLPPLVLASTSRYRRALLERLRVPFECEAPGVDEDSFKGGSLSPEQLAATLAREKALAVARRRPGSLVIGSDQVCAMEEQVLDKPGTREVALERLERLSGRPHRLVTAVAVVRDQAVDEFSDTTHLWMKPLTTEAIARYVDADQPLDCAGAYKLEELGITLFERIESADQTAIIGLPLIELCSVLQKHGYSLP